MIRKEGFVAPAVLEELKRIIEDSEVGNYLDAHCVQTPGQPLMRCEIDVH